MKKLFFQIILPLVVIAGILGFVTWFNPIKQQDAAWLSGQYTMSCGSNLTLDIIPVNESSCNNNNFTSEIQVKAAPGSAGAYHVHWNWGSYWCSDYSTDPNVHCKDTTHYNETGAQSSGLTGNNSAFVDAKSTSASSQGPFAGEVCGHFQNDFAFYVTDNNNPGVTICGMSLDHPGLHNQIDATTCNTGNRCVIPTATPTPTNTPTPTMTPTATPTQSNDCDNDGDVPADQTEDQECSPTATPTMTPTATPTGSTTTNCGDTTQTGNNDNNNCNNNDNNNQQQQQQNQTQNNNQTVNITLNGDNDQQQQQQQQQQVLAATSQPTQLPSTGAEGNVLFGLLALIPVGWKLRKLI